MCWDVDVIDAEKASSVKHDADGDDDDTVRQVVSATHSPSVTAATAADDDSDDDDGAGGAIVETVSIIFSVIWETVRGWL